jgi:FkbM family methyltransferase
MSRLDRFVGIARSVAIYHGIPFRQRRMRRLYSTFVKPGDLVFDVGAHAGNRVRGFASLGCRVVALEPQPDFAQLLRTLFARSPLVEIVEAAASAEAGHASLSISDRTPTVTTLAAAWREARSHEADFGGVRWNRRIDIETTTLDVLIARCGVPAFVKIDVEGAEPAVLTGLSKAVPALSFEYVPGAIDEVRACISRLGDLGRYLFNWSAGETFRLASSSWMTGEELLASLSTPNEELRSGDVYARLQHGGDDVG